MQGDVRFEGGLLPRFTKRREFWKMPLAIFKFASGVRDAGEGKVLLVNFVEKHLP